MSLHFTRFCFPLLLISLFCLSGCGGGDSRPSGYAVSGNVTIDGEPVSSAQIEFAPVDAGLEAGPSSFGEIRDGKYSISADRGPQAGKMLVTFSLVEYDQDGESGEESYFVTYYEVTEESEQTFNLEIEGKKLLDTLEPDDE